MKFVQISDGILIAGEHVDAGTVLEIGVDIEQAEAEQIVRLARAVEAENPKAKKAPAA